MVTFFQRHTRGVTVLCSSLLAASVANAASLLSIDKAVHLAIKSDPVVSKFHYQASALDDQAIAVGGLPSPRLSLAAANFPTDTFSSSQEPMTRLNIGISQAFPRGDTLEIRSRRKSLMANMQRHLAADRRARVASTVRNTWLELYYWIRAEQVVKQHRRYFSQMVKVTEYQYGAGKRSQQNVIHAQLELKLLDDRLTRIRARQDKLRAALAKWIPAAEAAGALPTALPQLPAPRQQQVLIEGLERHPLMLAAAVHVDNSRHGVALARQAYKPGFMVGINYGKRFKTPAGVDRADFLTIGVTMDLPLFRKKQNDGRLRASQSQVNAAKSMREERYRMLRRSINARYAEWQRINERMALYRKTLIPKAEQNAEAALTAYQSETSDFGTLMKARIIELNTKLKYLRLQVNRERTKAVLLYLAGGKQ